MQDNRNTGCSCNSSSHSNSCGNGTVIIDTKRVLDTCKDRDCYEDVRVYLTASGESILASATNVRTRSARLVGAYVGLDEIPFNCGFYQIKVKYYVELEFEGCVSQGRSVCFTGLSVLEKDIVLYGGEGRAVSFSSSENNSYCNVCVDMGIGNDPVAIVETVDPVVLSTKVVDCNCPCVCPCGDYADIPEGIRNSLCEELVINSDGNRILVSLGIFSVIRIVRSAQLLVSATDYSVPDKECTSGKCNDNPCDLFRNIAFPINSFRGTDKPIDLQETKHQGGGCGCR